MADMSDRTSGYRIHTYTAAEAGLFVNSYLIETSASVVLVDANLLLSDVRALAARIAARCVIRYSGSGEVLHAQAQQASVRRAGSQNPE